MTENQPIVSQAKSRVLPLRRTKPKKKIDDKPLAGFDIETDGLGGDFIAGAIWTSDDIRMLFDDFNKLVEWIITHPQYLFLAHNASGYEFAYMAPHFYHLFANRDDVELHPTFQGDSRLVQMRIDILDSEGRTTRRGKPIKTTIDIRDTLCLWPMSLAKVADAFCPDIPKLKVINFEKETFDLSNELHRQYVLRDCEIVVRAYQAYRENVRTVFGSELGVTAGSTALKAFSANLSPNKAYYRDRKSEALVRRGYYGGLVLPGHQVGEWGEIGCIDVNAAYGYQMMTHQFPVGSSIETGDFHEKWIGFYDVEATVPDSVFDTLGFNPVPRKDKAGLCWPSGTFRTTLSSPEITYAREKGCTINVIWGYVWPRSEDVFSEFMKTCEEWEVKEGGRYKPAVKQQRNSLYGKFGSKETHKVMKFSREIIPDATVITNEKTGEIVDGIYMVDEKTDAPYMLPHWAALITAYERLYLMKFIELAYASGAKNVYTDTDSLKFDLPVLQSILRDNALPIGDTYGKFKLEETCDSFILVGGKCFYGTVSNGKDLVKAKGLPRGLLQKSDYLDSIRNLKYNQKTTDLRKSKEFTSVKSVVSIFKERSHVKPIKRKRKLTDIRNSYAWQYREGFIYPLGYDVERRHRELPEIVQWSQAYKEEGRAV